MTRSRRSAKEAGTRWESRIIDFLHESGFPLAERRAKRGVLDAGDVSGLPGIVVEAKDRAAITLAAFVAEANAEALNAQADVGVAWVKRIGKGSPADGYVVCDGAAFVRLLRRLHDAEHQLAQSKRGLL